MSPSSARSRRSSGGGDKIRAMTTLVTGPSGVGKSTLLESAWLRRHHGAVEREQVVIGSQVPQGRLDESAAYVHYNLTHYLLLPAADPSEPVRARLEREPILSQILALPTLDRALVIVSPIQELVERASGRTHVELDLPDVPYDSAGWVQRLQGVDLFALYEQLYALLDERDVAVDVVFSSRRLADGFAASDRAFTHHNLRGRYVLPPERATAETVAALPGCHYQSVPLPAGVVTSSGYGHVAGGRAATFEATFTESLVGASVLDVGCANGDFLFRAERLGAGRLVGVELHKERFEAAEAIARLLMSDVRVHRGSFFDYATDERFDYVLVLNVVHHIRDFDRFLAHAASFATHRLVVEFPTLTDKKFSDYRRIDLRAEANDLPLVGVSGQGADQTYVFAPEAMIRIVAEGVGGFSTAHARPSPIANRSLLVFTR
jgi:2-polyprenyl-3-methyl-5-hydroxy-6-metoxy-1,4-benzoquinol methylase